MIVNIKKSIGLSPAYFDTGIKKHLFNKLKQETENECSEQNGYIINVKKLVRIINNSISPTTSETIFDLEFQAETIKPVKNQEFSAVVCMVFSEGILAEVKNKLKVLIPMHYIEGYEFSNCILRKDEKTIEKNSVIDIIVVSAKYSDGAFSCIAQLKE